MNDTEAREIGDGAADELRTRLEQKYAPKLLAIVSKAPETDKKYKSTWDEYVAYVKDAGVSPVPPRSRIRRVISRSSRLARRPRS